MNIEQQTETQAKLERDLENLAKTPSEAEMLETIARLRGDNESLTKRFNDICGEVQMLRAIVRNDSENEDRARRFAAMALPEKLVYGDSYGVPTIDEIVERLVSVPVASRKVSIASSE